MKTWYFIIDVEKCENCNNCFLACKDEHVDNDWPGYAAAMSGQGPSWISIDTKERGRHPFIDVAYLPQPCMHCDNAPCMKAAQDGAVYKRPDGIVIIDPVKAKGKKELTTSCPYGAIGWNETSDLPQKCTFCAHLIDEGWTKTRCTQACPTGALSLLNMEKSEMKELIDKEKLETYHPKRGTNPRVYYKNLYRFTRCFIGGSVAMRVKGVEDCLEGAKVTLSNAAGEAIGETITDNYGDFKFDNLGEDSGTYIVKIAGPGGEIKSVEAHLGKSFYTGVVYFDFNNSI